LSFGKGGAATSAEGDFFGDIFSAVLTIGGQMNELHTHSKIINTLPVYTIKGKYEKDML
jgi:hypothetical protein